MKLQPTTPAEVQAAVNAHRQVLPRGGGSKPALSTPPADIPALEMSGLAGVLEYEPGEFTFTALAGTPVRQVEALLAGHGQHLPFDPLLAERGATLGGTVATNAGGPGRYRYGGVRDFLLGVRFVDGDGRLVYGGGKVVKNSAGFDLPKLLVGSMGRLGVLVELTFKVFPGPAAYTTLRVDYGSPAEAVEAIYRLAVSPLELYALDLEAPAEGRPARLWLRQGGLAGALPDRLERLRQFLGGGEVYQGAEEAALWQAAREFAWAPPGWSLVKVPLTPRRIILLEEALAGSAGRRRYSAGGNVAWLAWPAGELDRLHTTLAGLELAGLVLVGQPGRAWLGVRSGDLLLRRVKQALDPAGRFLEV